MRWDGPGKPPGPIPPLTVGETESGKGGVEGRPRCSGCQSKQGHEPGTPAPQGSSHRRSGRGRRVCRPVGPFRPLPAPFPSLLEVPPPAPPPAGAGLPPPVPMATRALAAAASQPQHRPSGPQPALAGPPEASSPGALAALQQPKIRAGHLPVPPDDGWWAH